MEAGRKSGVKVGVASAEEADLLHRIKKKVKQGEGPFSREHTGPVAYNDEIPNDQGKVQGLQNRSYKETLLERQLMMNPYLQLKRIMKTNLWGERKKRITITLMGTKS